jgi:hypothetical protein
MKMAFRVLPYLLLLFCSITAAGQHAATPDFKISVNSHYGFLISHHGTMRYLVKGHIGGGEISFIKPTYGNQLWHRVYHYPEWGFSAMYLDLSNPDVLGNLYGGVGFINFPVPWRKKPTRLNGRAAIGVGYLTKAFDRLENHKNIAIGSKLNALVDLRLNSHFNLSRHMRLEVGLGLVHASNGSSVMPNLGINMPTFNLGLTYDFSAGSKQRITDSITPLEKKLSFAVLATGGLTEIEPVLGPKFPVASVSGNMSWPMEHRWNGIAGIDVMYNTANLEKLHRDTSIVITSNLANLQPGIKIGGEIFAGKFSMPIELGVYMYTRMTRNGYFYQRTGLRYHWNEHWFANFTLKTHFAKADYFDWGVGYKF